MTELDVYTSTGRPWFTMSTGWELLDPRVDELMPVARDAEIDIRVDMDLRASLASAGAEEVYVIFVLSTPEDIGDLPGKPKYRLKDGELRVTMYTAYPPDGPMGQQFRQWVVSQMREAVTGWKGLRQTV